MTTLETNGLTIFISQHKLIELDDLEDLAIALNNRFNCKIPAFQSDELDTLIMNSGAHVEKENIENGMIMVTFTYRMEDQEAINQLALQVHEQVQENEDFDNTALCLVSDDNLAKHFSYKVFDDDTDVLIQLF